MLSHILVVSRFRLEMALVAYFSHRTAGIDILCPSWRHRAAATVASSSVFRRARGGGWQRRALFLLRRQKNDEFDGGLWQRAASAEHPSPLQRDGGGSSMGGTPRLPVAQRRGLVGGGSRRFPDEGDVAPSSKSPIPIPSSSSLAAPARFPKVTNWKTTQRFRYELHMEHEALLEHRDARHYELIEGLSMQVAFLQEELARRGPSVGM
nr:hypothetical protein Iba_chr02eCG6870 [Ipomoea batatas]